MNKPIVIISAGPAGRLAEPHISKVLVFGLKTRSKYNHAVLLRSCQHLLKDPRLTIQNAIKSQLTTDNDTATYAPTLAENA